MRVLCLRQVLIAAVDVGAGKRFEVLVLDLEVARVVDGVVLGRVDDGVTGKSCVDHVLLQRRLRSNGHIPAVVIVVQEVIVQSFCDGHESPARFIGGVIRAQAPDATQLNHAVAVDSFKPTPVTGVEGVVLNFKNGFGGVACALGVERSQIVYQFVRAQVHHFLQRRCCSIKFRGIVAAEVCPVEVGLAHQCQGGTFRGSSFLARSRHDGKHSRRIFAVVDDLLHNLRQGVALQIHFVRGQFLGNDRDGTEVTEHFKVVERPQEFGLREVHLYRIGRQRWVACVGVAQQAVHPVDADVAAAVERVKHGVGVGFREIIEFLPSGLVVVGGVAAGVGIV